MIGDKSEIGEFDRIEHQNHIDTFEERIILSDQSGEGFIEEDEEEKIEYSEIDDFNEEEKFEKIVLEKNQTSLESEEEDLDLSNRKHNAGVSMIQIIKDLGFIEKMICNITKIFFHTGGI